MAKKAAGTKGPQSVLIGGEQSPNWTGDDCAMISSDRVAAALIIAGTALIVLALIIPTAVMMSIWDNPSTPPDTVLRIGVLQRADSLNPNVGIYRTSQLFYSLVYDCLQSVDEDLDVTPNLASSWYPVPTSDPELQQTGEPYGSVWQYNLTHNAFWHDGVPFTASDVVFTFNLNAWNYSSMWAFQPYSYFMKDTDEVDDYTIRTHFYERATGNSIPVAYADLMSIPILPKHKLENMNPFTIAFNWTGIFVGEEFPIVGTGPFTGAEDIREEWVAGDHITLVRNSDYHAKKDGNLEIHFDKIRIYFYEEAEAVKLALTNKLLDIARFDGEGYVELGREVGNGTAKNVVTYRGLSPAQDSVYLSWLMNSAGPNLARLDPTVRTALAMATNKSWIASNICEGLAQEASTVTSPINTRWHYEPNATERIRFDPDGARLMLESAGYVDTDADDVRECTQTSFAVLNDLVAAGTHLSFDMAVFRDRVWRAQEIGEDLLENWRDVGVAVDLRIIDDQVSPTYCPVDLDVALMAGSQDLDPNRILFAQSRRAWGGWSDSRYFSEQYEANYNLSVSAMSPGDRKQYVDNCQRTHYLDIPYLNLVYTDQLFAWRNDSFVGWGYWASDPGLSLDNIWGAPPLLFNLMPVSIVIPQVRQDLIAYSATIICGTVGLGLVIAGALRRRAGLVG